MPRLLVMLVLAVTAGQCVAAARDVDASTVDRWKPQEGFVTHKPDRYSVTAEGGSLVFTAEGVGSELPWTITLTSDEIDGDARYLVVDYRAEGLANPPGNYLLHGWEGTPGGRTLALSDEIEVDGAWHTLATDLVAVQPQGALEQLAVKVIVGDAASARLEIRCIRFADTLPEGARVSRVAASPAESIALPWSDYAEIAPQPAWALRPATDFSAVCEDADVAFSVRGVGRQMRWPVALREPVDLGRLSYFSVRYRATGAPGRGGYVVWLGDSATGAGGHAVVPFLASDLRADGRWHNFTARVSEAFVATQLAVGLDCDADEATVTLGPVVFGTAPPRWSVGDLLPHETRDAPWPAGQDGWTVLPAPATGGVHSPFLGQRLDLSGWFESAHITVGGVPFETPASAAEAPQTGTSALGELAIDLPPDAREVYLLTGATAPPAEPFGIDYEHPRAVEFLSEPEKVVLEIRYAEGPPDLVLPVDVETGKWGMKRGLGVSVAHPGPARKPTALVVRDLIRSASIALLGATVRTDEPRVAEPSWAGLSYAPGPGRALDKLGPVPQAAPGAPVVTSGKLSARIAVEPGLGLRSLGAGDDPGALGIEPGPLFEVQVGGEVLASETWTVVEAAPIAQGWRFVARHEGTGLRATVTCSPAEGNALRLEMTLANEGAKATTATVRFPVLRGVRLGDAGSTWYLSGRRGGVINREPVAFRDPLGEPHPLQVDGFFSPAKGLALACTTHDTIAQHHFVTLGKDSKGGSWAPEYVERDLAPGAMFSTTEAELRLLEGDWRAIFGAYRAWLATWYRPPASKPWWERTYAFITKEASYVSNKDPERRGEIRPVIDDCVRYLGVCDYVHLFGWSSSERYGDWGDYDHYDETVGGLERFRGSIASSQGRGVPVGLYIDGYLSSGAGESVGAHAEEWSMKGADGKPQYIDVYKAYNECPYMPGWRAHLMETYARVHRETGAMGLYVDEYGATDGRWACHAKDHGHNGFEVPYAGEAAMLAALREAVGPEVALYSEYPPAEVSRQFLDGSFTYQALWSVDQESLAPHFIDLPRFAFPAFKQFHITYYVPTRDGNWWLLKFPFFNGESYDLGQPNLPLYDDAAMAFQRRAIEVLCAHREAFASSDVYPLVPTTRDGVFANEFRTPTEAVYTLYNANGRTVRGSLLTIPHREGATYDDAWAGVALTPTIRESEALIELELPPKGIGCVVQRSL